MGQKTYYSCEEFYGNKITKPSELKCQEQSICPASPLAQNRELTYINVLKSCYYYS